MARGQRGIARPTLAFAPTRRAVLACGFSGHGFEHSPILGDLIADLGLGTPPRDPPLDLGFLALSRFSEGRPHRPRHAYSRVLLGR